MTKAVVGKSYEVYADIAMGGGDNRWTLPEGETLIVRDDGGRHGCPTMEVLTGEHARKRVYIDPDMHPRLRPL